MAKPVRREQIEDLRTSLAAVSAGQELSRSQLAGSCRTICALLAERHPGGTVELRVPPFAAVQLGLGERGRHTRGTPPNVVQTEPLTLLRLATGELPWATAVAEHLVTASGIHSDLGSIWPLPEARR